MLLKDNKWHYVDMAPGCHCPDCTQTNAEALYARLRPDGRCLTISDDDAFQWYGMEKRSGDVSKLTGVGEMPSDMYVATTSTENKTKLTQFTDSEQLNRPHKTVTT